MKKNKSKKQNRISVKNQFDQLIQENKYEVKQIQNQQDIPKKHVFSFLEHKDFFYKEEELKIGLEEDSFEILIQKKRKYGEINTTNYYESSRLRSIEYMNNLKQILLRCADEVQKLKESIEVSIKVQLRSKAQEIKNQLYKFVDVLVDNTRVKMENIYAENEAKYMENIIEIEREVNEKSEQYNKYIKTLLNKDSLQWKNTVNRLLFEDHEPPIYQLCESLTEESVQKMKSEIEKKIFQVDLWYRNDEENQKQWANLMDVNNFLLNFEHCINDKFGFYQKKH